LQASVMIDSGPAAAAVRAVASMPGLAIRVVFLNLNFC
jgi:hypothetical protein